MVLSFSVASLASKPLRPQHDLGVQCDAVQRVHVGWLSQGVVEVKNSVREMFYIVRKCQALVRVKVRMP